MSKRSKDDYSGALGIVLFICLLLIVFVNAPGMLVLGFVKMELLPSLDISQVWVFSVIVSLVFLGFFILISRDLGLGFIYYMGLCTASVGICVVLYFGFKIGFPEVYMKYFLDGSSYVPVK